ncbi:hypothetical protein E3N88_26480 [Mikania micrantha]|uniref:Uncharacterized protein n=1 Tax=Mikania micrantha TaxID=192012 RepID=A0A5N6NAC7_9ASTR|nr:hypothetical protein E3N88_26480 [Mikania micrantha]
MNSKNRKSSEAIGTLEAHVKSASDNTKNSHHFGRRKSEEKSHLKTKSKPSEEKAKVASDGSQKKKIPSTVPKVKKVWKKKETSELTVQPIGPSAGSSSVPPKMISKKFSYNDENGKPKTTWAWVPIRN